MTFNIGNCVRNLRGETGESKPPEIAIDIKRWSRAVLNQEHL